MKYDLIVDSKGIKFRIFPFRISYQTLIWNDITSIQMVKFDSVKHFYKLSGIAHHKRFGKAVFSWQNIGIFVKLNTNQFVTLGIDQISDVSKIHFDIFQEKFQMAMVDIEVASKECADFIQK